MAARELFTSEHLWRWQATSDKDYELVAGELYETLPHTVRQGQVVAEPGRAWTAGTPTLGAEC